MGDRVYISTWFLRSTVSFANYGTILHVSSVQSMEDGRFLLCTRGERRFKVLERGVMDGYHTAKIMFQFDERVTNQEEIGEEEEREEREEGVPFPSLQILCEFCRRTLMLMPRNGCTGSHFSPR